MPATLGLFDLVTEVVEDASSLELLTPDGKYNYIGYLLADENGVSVKVAKYAETETVV